MERQSTMPCQYLHNIFKLSLAMHTIEVSRRTLPSKPKRETKCENTCPLDIMTRCLQLTITVK